MTKIRVGILGATGMVGQRFVTLLKNHPMFEVVALAASPKSAGKTYREAVSGRWLMDEEIPSSVKDIKVQAVEEDLEKISSDVSLVFSALDMEKEVIREIENSFAARGAAVVSNNSAHRTTSDVPMVMPEINPGHLALIKDQQKNHGWDKGFVVVKPNCSIQSYVPLLTPLLKYAPEKVIVTTLQAVSGAGKTMKTWPEMQDNVIPFIPGEEVKSENEPMKIWGKLKGGVIEPAKDPRISATCIRVPVSDGHMAAVSVSFAKKPSVNEILSAWSRFDPLSGLDLPSSPHPFIAIMTEEDRPQTKLDRRNDMGISVGRLKEDDVLDYKFVALSHNTVRGAAGGAVLTAELLKAKGYI